MLTEPGNVDHFTARKPTSSGLSFLSSLIPEYSRPRNSFLVATTVATDRGSQL